MTHEPHVRRMTLVDIAPVFAIERRVFSSPWSEASFAQELETNRAACYLVLDVDSEVVAYAGTWFVIDEAHITNIAVSPDHRRRGYGRIITQALLDTARDNGMRLATLEVRRSNLAAQHLYHALGFHDVGYRKRYYTDNNEDALIMYKLLQDGIEPE